jgi:phage replication initiation protein
MSDPAFVSLLPSAPEGQHSQVTQRSNAADSESAERALAHANGAMSASSRLVITGGNLAPPDTENLKGKTAHIDWFACTLNVLDKTSYADEQLFFISELLRFLAIKESQLVETDKGWFGYTDMAKIMSPDGLVNYGLIAYGGESQKGSIHVEVNAQGCAAVVCWEEIAEWGEKRNAVITRLDLAHDDFTGDEITIGVALDWYREGRFDQNGRPPKAQHIDDLGSGSGRTLYVGNRKSGKLLRVYEKGKQLGDTSSRWTRVEVELRNKGRVIPWGALTRPGHFLAGSFPCLAYLSAIQEKVRTLAKAAQTTLTVATNHLQKSGGKLVDLLMNIHNENAVAVVQRIRGEGIPRRLAAYASYLRPPASLEDKS